MKVKELRSVLADIEGIYAAAGADKAAEDFRQLCSILDGYDDSSVDDFIAEMGSIYAPQPRSGAAKTPATELDRPLVEEFAQRLRAAGLDREAFERVLAELGRDTRVRKGEANAIQHLYIGGREAWPTRKAALEAIEKTFHQRRFQAAAMKDVAKVTPW